MLRPAIGVEFVLVLVCAYSELYDFDRFPDLFKIKITLYGGFGYSTEMTKEFDMGIIVRNVLKNGLSAFRINSAIHCKSHLSAAFRKAQPSY